MTTLRRRFVGPVLEFLLIVAGILVALGIDDWRQQRADRRAEQYFIAGLISDLRETRGDVADIVAEAADQTESADLVLAALAGGDFQDRAGLEVAVVSMTPIEIAIDLVDATYREILSAGGLALITDERLRADIGRFYSRASYRVELPDALTGEARRRYESLLFEYGLLYHERERVYERLGELGEDERFLAAVRGLGQSARIEGAVVSAQLLEPIDALLAELERARR